MRRSMLCLMMGAVVACESKGSYDADTGGAVATDGAYAEAPEAGGADAADTGYDWGSETEDDFLRLVPAATDAYVFVANPTRDTVTRVSVSTLEVVTVEVGSNPAIVATTPDYRRAVTFNQDSDDVSIVQSADLSVQSVPVRENYNQMLLSPDGAWVVCFNDPDLDEDGGTSGTVSFNDISLVDVAAGVHHPIVVGFRPKQIKFSPDSRLALVVSDEYLAIVDLTRETLERELLAITDDFVDPPSAEEVVITPNGEYAFVRQYGVNEVLVADLDAMTVDAIAVGQNPTDLDLDPAGDRAVLVARDSAELWVLDAGDPLAVAPEVVPLPETEIIGSLVFSPDNQKAVLFTTAADSARFHVWDVASGDVETRPLGKPVRSLTISPTGDSLLVVHTEGDGFDADPDHDLYGVRHALTLIDLDDFATSPLALPSAFAGYADSFDGRWGFFITEDEPLLTVIEWASLLDLDVPLYSAAVHVGVMPDTTSVFVNQEHDLGRLSFYDAESEVIETVTGFELNSGIEH